jgi:hypothetical protein
MKVLIIFERWKIAPLCTSIETVKSGCFFFVSRVEILQVLGVEVSTGESTESNVGTRQGHLKHLSRFIYQLHEIFDN